MLDVSPVEIRIVGALIEKQRTTPDGYPLTLNALRAACNQTTSRDPVVDYHAATLRGRAGAHQAPARRPGVRFRRPHPPRGAGAPRPPRLDAARQRAGQPGA